MRDDLTRGLLEASGSHSWTVLLSSHDIEEVERLADWIGYLDRGRLVFAEPVASLLERFRRVEVVAPEGAAPALPDGIKGLSIERAGRTLRFVDGNHATSSSEARLAAAIPGAEINSSPVPLREIFVTLAREAASKRRVAEAS